jgi:hypothetical protein
MGEGFAWLTGICRREGSRRNPSASAYSGWRTQAAWALFLLFIVRAHPCVCRPILIWKG